MIPALGYLHYYELRMHFGQFKWNQHPSFNSSNCLEQIILKKFESSSNNFQMLKKKIPLYRLLRLFVHPLKLISKN